MKLKAYDVTELHVLSGFLQGSIFTIDMIKVTSEKLEIHNFNRYMWESQYDYKRTISSLEFYNIKHCIVSKNTKKELLVLLAIVALEKDHLRVYCANSIYIDIHLASYNLEIYLEDSGYPWFTNKPPLLFQ